MNQQNNPFNDMSKGIEQINPLEYPAVKCTDCGCEIFSPALMFREIPGSLLGQAGQTVQYPMKVFCCKNCNALSPADQDIINKLKEKAEEKQNKSSIII